MLKQYPSFRRDEIEKVYEMLPGAEKGELEGYIRYRQANGLNAASKVADLRRIMLQLRHLHSANWKKLDLDSLRGMLVLINRSELSDSHKNEIKTNLKNYLKWKFRDWSERFSNLDDIKLIQRPTRNTRPVSPKEILKKEDIERLMRHETSMFWKAFLITQYEGGLRTKETRFLKWGDIAFDIDEDISEVNLFATKTKERRTIFVKEATYYLKRLQEEQENMKAKGSFVFHSRDDIDKPVDRSTISNWMTTLSKKALGRHVWNYLLRHSRATELYTLAKQAKISKDTATDFLGHSQDMSEVYTHLDTSALKEIIKSQVYRIEELPPERKSELEEEVHRLKENMSLKAKEVASLRSQLKELAPVNEAMRKLLQNPKFLKFVGVE